MSVAIEPWRLVRREPEPGMPWVTIDEWSHGPDWSRARRERIESVPSTLPTLTMLRVVSPRGTPGRAYIVAHDGIQRRVRYSVGLPSETPLVALRSDPAAWWAECTDGRDLLSVAAAVSSPSDELHWAVVRAACACARETLPLWEAHYPTDRRPRIAIETAEARTRGEASLDQLREAVRAAREAAEERSRRWELWTAAAPWAASAAWLASAYVEAPDTVRVAEVPDAAGWAAGWTVGCTAGWGAEATRAAQRESWCRSGVLVREHVPLRLVVAALAKHAWTSARSPDLASAITENGDAASMRLLESIG